MNRGLREQLDRIEKSIDSNDLKMRDLVVELTRLPPRLPKGDGPVLWVPTVPVLWSCDMPDLRGGQGRLSPGLYTQSGPFGEVLLTVDSHGQTLWLQAQRSDGMVSNRVQIAWTRKGLTS